MFRQEFLPTWSGGLSADAFSNFQIQRESAASNNEAKLASEYLKSEVVAKVGSDLINSTGYLNLSRVFHKHGLNMRYLGLVYRNIVRNENYSKTKFRIYVHLQTEALMRVLKKRFRSTLRATSKLSQSEGYEDESLLMIVASRVLNQFFGKKGNVSAWIKENNYALEDLQHSFNFTPRHARACIEIMRSTDVKVQEQNHLGVEKVKKKKKKKNRSFFFSFLLGSKCKNGNPASVKRRVRAKV
jgi:hypothetical protein